MCCTGHDFLKAQFSNHEIGRRGKGGRGEKGLRVPFHNSRRDTFISRSRYCRNRYFVRLASSIPFVQFDERIRIEFPHLAEPLPSSLLTSQRFEVPQRERHLRFIPRQLFNQYDNCALSLQRKPSKLDSFCHACLSVVSPKEAMLAK